MFDTATSAVAAYVPAATITLPLLGDVDLQKLVLAAAVFVGVTALCWFVRLVVLVRLRALAERSSAKLDDTVVEMMESIRPWVYTLVALYAALNVFDLPEAVGRWLGVAVLVAVVWQVIQMVSCFITYIVTNYLEKDEDGDGVIDPGAANMAGMVSFVAQLVLWVFGGIFILSNLGIEVTSLIAGLGIGGIAIAFALQGVLTDLFASVSIYLDKPFRVGDRIIIGTDSGTVERIGIKSTRIRTLQGEELIVSNTELTTARIQNFHRMDERRNVVQIGVTYETPLDRVGQVNGIVERIFEDIDGAHLSRTHFKTFGDSALLFEIVYYVESSDYNEFMDIQQRFNFMLMERFAEVGIDFAYPTQMVYEKRL